MFTCDFSKRGSRSLTQFLYDSLKNEILEGRIKPHQKIPSKRELSEHLGVSVITVQNAYLQLIDEGWIYSVEKKGYFAEETGSFPKNPAPADPPKTKGTSNFISDSGTLPSFSQSAHTELIADFTSNSTQAQAFPFATWTKVNKTVLAQYTTSILDRQDFRGTFFLRQQICQYLKNFRGMDVNPDQVVIGAGTESLYSMVIKFFGQEKIYGMENPGYKKLSLIFSTSGCRCIPLSMDENGLDIQNLQNTSVEIVHVTPSHHFPTGRVMSVKRRNELLEWAERSGGYILEDDYDSEFRFLGQPLQALYSADKNGRTFYMNTFSKTLSPSFRISFMIIPSPLLNSFINKMGFYSCTVGSFEQYTLAQFMKEGHFERHIRRMKNYYKNLRNSLIYALEHNDQGKNITILEEHAGLHFLMQVKSEKTEKELQKELLEKGIKLALLKDYDLTASNIDQAEPSPNATFVINYSGIEKEKILEIVRIMTACF